ncbi:MAG TPA: hypothetical protein DCL43_11415 [Chitinophagaceae bacterium]|nr:hypothetical protein [Chitinophagaceae bacterium]
MPASYQTIPLLRRIPFLRLLIPLCIGILLQWYYNIAHPIWWLVATVTLTIVVILPKYTFKWHYKYPWITGASLQCFITMLGIQLCWLHQWNKQPNCIQHFISDTTYTHITLLEPPVKKTRSYKILAKANAVWQAQQWQATTGYILLYITQADSTPNLHYGQTLIIKGLQPIRNAGNPGSFNYATYTAQQHIYAQAFIPYGKWQLLPTSSTNTLQTFILSIRQKATKTLQLYIPEKDEAAIATALLIGARDYLDRELVQAYSNTGVVHIIAISGLHLGMIYGLLQLLFRKVPHRYRWFKAIVSLLVLWLFTLVAGAAPSILRSAIMFSCIIVADSMQRKHYLLNTLAGAACVMLLFNPFYLWDVGFQLSFGAVSSIALFQKPISQLIYVTQPLLHYIWQMLALTLAAQALTLPFIVYHFHQFPLVFLISNLLAVPVSGVVLYGLMLLLFIACISSTVATYIGIAVQACIWWLNQFVAGINQLPFTTLQQLYITIPEATLLLLSLILVAAFIYRKEKQYLYIGATSLLLMLTSRSIHYYQCSQQQKIIVYNVPKHTAIDVVQGFEHQFIGDTALLKDDFLRNFHLQPSRIMHRTDQVVSLPHATTQAHLIWLGKQGIVVVNSSYIPVYDSRNIKFVLITKNPPIALRQITKHYAQTPIVIDGNNSYKRLQRWKSEADSLPLQPHITPFDGAYVVNY